MAPDFQDQGVGTILTVRDVGWTQPTCKVRWDGGKISTFASGSTISRDALARSRHPDTSGVELKRWIASQGWKVECLEGLSINAVLALGVDELQEIVGKPFLHPEEPEDKPDTPPSVSFDQLQQLHHFCQLEMQKANRSHPKASKAAVSVQTGGYGHDLRWQVSRSGGAGGGALPLMCCEQAAGFVLEHGQKASAATRERMSVQGLQGSVGSSLLKAHPCAARRLVR